MSLNKRLLHHFDHCLNCETSLAKENYFCPQCGQKRTTGRISFRQLILQFFEDTINWDARLFRTIRVLFVPGKLTEEFFLGRQVPYWQPLRLFLFLAALQMLVVNASLNNVNEKIKNLNENTKESAIEYVVLKKMDSLKTVASSGFSNKKNAVAAMDSLLNAYIYPERFNNRQISDNLIEAKVDSFKNAFLQEIAKENESIDSTELAEELEDFKKKLVKNAKKIDDKSDNLTSDYIDIDFVKIDGQPDIEPMEKKSDKGGWKIGYKPGKSDELVDINFNNKPTKSNGFRIKKADFLHLPVDSIITKYKVNGFFNQILAKQSIKAMRDGKDIIQFFISQLSWMLIIMMPFFALFLELVNRPYYYVEHVIFSFHCHSMLFLLISLVFFFNHKIIPEYTTVHGILNSLVLFYLIFYFYKAMRRVYKQNRFITLLKYGFLMLSYFISMSFALIITFLVSFVFF